MDKCYVCQQAINAAISNQYTHDHCKPGSNKWCSWFVKLPQSKRTEAGQLLYKWAKRKQQLAKDNIRG